METKYKEEDFRLVERELLGIGFFPKTIRSFKKDFVRLGLQAPRQLTGRETGFFYGQHGLTVKIWTTWLEGEKKFRDTGDDMAWVLITEGDKAVYFAKPIKRVGNFVMNLLRRAWVTKYKVYHRPLCSECSAFMDIVQRDNGQCFWICRKSEAHILKKPVTLGWDKVGPTGDIPEKAKLYVADVRERRKVYRDRNKRKGVVRTPAKKIRTSWKAKKPENKI